MDKKKIGNQIHRLLLALTLIAAGAGTGFSQSMNTNQTETATFGGGCFWCMEAEFQRIPGVVSVTSGFAGGHTANPSYEDVCTGDTGHAEVTQIVFDPQKVSYDKLLDYFWDAHDPTTLNQQGADVGTQYRSIILYSSPAQKAAAEKSKAEAQKNFKSPIVTQIAPLDHFYKAEDYHQDYYNNHTSAPYCQVVIKPKLKKFEQKLKEEKH
ncbi:MAG TPA: peptide-methionine (S)-S-oxide reductase MsrA [Verrucomicrobiae bacterium]|jgi:peptide-methionine (S)-S-oxide reductase|nr:peptide-methionine (S)-S-oxide reductase MsrA [Verrucomicrobiae bacterium]